MGGSSAFLPALSLLPGQIPVHLASFFSLLKTRISVPATPLSTPGIEVNNAMDSSAKSFLPVIKPLIRRVATAALVSLTTLLNLILASYSIFCNRFFSAINPISLTPRHVLQVPSLSSELRLAILFFYCSNNFFRRVDHSHIGNL